MPKKKQTIKKRSLFDHIKAITGEQDPNYFDKLSVEDKKTFSVYMINRYLSMNMDWIDVVAEVQPYIQKLPPEVVYKLYIDIIPKGRHYLKYVKGSNSGTNYESWLVELLAIEYECSQREAEDYLEILYKTKDGKIRIKEICSKWGIEPKQITKLKLKV